MAVRKHRATDRRVRKTDTRLHEALMSLIHDKSYESIAVRDILDRADVGRSTFYTHFRDKDDLLASGIYEALQSMRSTAAALSDPFAWFSLPIFEHIHRHRLEGKAAPLEGRGLIHVRLQRTIEELIAADIVRRFARRRVGPVPAELAVKHVASTFILVLNWWLDVAGARSPHDADALFRALVIPVFAV
jgi:AcrR family transcriptional regulator